MFLSAEIKEQIYNERTTFLKKRVEFTGETLPLVAKSFTRYQLAELFRDLGYKKGAEIGVARGLFSEHLCKTIPELELICVDPWAKYDGNPRARRDEHQEQCLTEARDRLKGFNVSFMRMLSREAVLHIHDKSLDFVYIDGNHTFDFVMEDLILWGRKVKYGGVISGDDYYEFKWAGVVGAVQAYVRAHEVKEWYITSDVNLKSAQSKNRSEPSFFWFRIN